MFAARCYLCGYSNEFEESAAWSPCRQCQRPLHLGSLRQLEAIERLAQRSRNDPDLEERCRDELLAVLHRHQVEVTTAAVLQKPPAPPTPERQPRSATPPPLPISVAEPAAAAAAMVATVAQPKHAAQPSWPGPPIPPRGPSLWARLGPLFGENLLFALAGFLLVAGAVYFTTTAWTTMSGSTQKLVVAGGLLLFAALTHGAGVVLGKEEGLRSAARVLAAVAMALAPAASTVAGLLYAENSGLALLVAAVSAAAGHLFLRTLSRREGHSLQPAVPWLHDALVFAGVFAGALLDLRLLASCALAAGPLLVAWLQRRTHRITSTVPATTAFTLLATVIAAMAAAFGMAIAHGAPFATAIAPLGVVLAAAALAAVVLESARGERAAAAITTALAVAISAVLVATGDLRCLMVAAWCAAATCLQASLRLDRARLLMPALVLSAIGYLFLPAPIRELAMRLRAEAASQLGYEPQRLPLSFYGITFVPYLLGLALLGMWFRRTQRDRHRRLCSSWAMSVAAGLALMSLLLGRDLRAPMAVLPVDGVLLVLLGYLSRSATAVLAGCVGVLGGMACALVWLDVPAGVGTAVGTGAAMTLFVMSLRPADSETFAARARRSYGHAATIALVASSGWCLSGAWPPQQQSAWNLLHATVLLPVLAMLRRTDSPLQNVTRRAPITLVLLVLPALQATATGVAMVLADYGVATARFAMPAATACVTFAMHGLLQVLPSTTDHHARRALVIGLFVLHVPLLPDLIAGYDPRSVAWITILGTALLAGAAGSLAARVRLDALLALAVVEFALPQHLLATAWLGDASGPPGLLGPTVLAGAVAVLGRNRLPVAAVACGMAAIVAVLLVSLRLAQIPAVPSTQHASASLAVAIMLLLVPAWLARSSTTRTQAVDQVWLFVGAGTALVAPLLLLDLIATGVQQYAAGMLGIGLLAFVLATRWQRIAVPLSLYGLLQMVVATALLFRWQPVDEPGHLLRLGAFAAAAAIGFACRLRTLRTPATLIMAVAAFGALVQQPFELGWLGTRWRIPLTLGWCAIGLGLTALPKWSSRAFAARLIAVPAAIVMAIMLIAACALACSTNGSQMLPRSAADVTLIDVSSLAFVAAVIGLACHLPRHLRGRVVWLAAGIALFATAPINGLLRGDRSAGMRPDAESALLALAIASWGRVHVVAAGWLLCVAAVALTTLQLTDLSTPVTATLLAGVPLALMLRRLPGPNAAMHGVLLVLATWSWITFALVGRDAAQLGPWLGLSAAMLGALCGPWLRLFTKGQPLDEQVLALRAVTWIAALAAVAAFCAKPPAVMPQADLLAALAAGALVAIGSMRAARSSAQAPLVQIGLAAVIACYLILVVGTDLLVVMTGRHHHALTVLGATLFLSAGHRRTPVADQLRGAAVVTTVLAAALASGLGGLTFALLAGAMVMALGAAVGRMRWLAALALTMANAGLFRLWLLEGIFDPSFYGVPAGLSLVFGAELARPALGDSRVVALRITGLSVLYGAVLIQIAQVAVPLHALALFVLAMAAVAYGALRRQAAVMITGVIAVVLDVVAYLAQRGFEQDFLGSMLLVGAGGALFLVASMTARRRSRQRPPAA